MACEQYTSQVLQQLGLSKNSVISNIGMLRQDDSNPRSEVNSSNAVSRFLCRMNSFDYRAVLTFKDMTFPNQLSKNRFAHLDMNCLDAVLVILNQCDDFARQRLLECMAKCNLSVPILLPNLRETGPSVFQQWALTTIIKTIPRGDKFDDVFISRHPFHIALFVRFGELKDFCIPEILNTMIGEAQEINMPYNFYGGNINSSPSKLSDGLLEAVWFVPDDRYTSLKDWQLKSPLCFSYFHGNPNSHKKEFEFGCKSSSVIVVFISKESFKKYRDKFSELRERKQVIIAVLSSKRRSKNDTLRGLDRIRVRDFNGTNVKDIAKALCTDLSFFLSDAFPSNFTLHQAGSFVCKSQGIPIDMNSFCQRGLECAQKIEMLFNCSEESFDKIFKLIHHWEVFSKLYKDTQWKRATTNISHQMEQHRQQLRQSRISQFQECLSVPMRFFLDILEGSSYMEHIYILSWLKLFLKGNYLWEERRYRQKLFSVRDMFDQIQTDYGHPSDECYEKRPNLSHKKEISKSNYGIDTLLQELGQLYECHTYIKNDCSHIAKVAANMMLNGHPIVIFDGKTGNVPIHWLTGILNAVQGIIGDQNIFVVSILGIQSAGKSTFLNTLFGTNFEANAGRCTKGVSIQMIKVQEALCKEIGCRFVLIMDTEGLQQSQDFYKMCNEMATFVLSLSNFAFLNIAGQTIESDIKNVLQIAALAFLRMNQVNLKCDCFVVQQLVSDPTTLQKNRHDILSLLQQIELAVRHAAKIENIEIKNTKRYPDIFKILNFEEGLQRLQYFPPLWGGKSMSPPETSYSELILELRKGLISVIKKNSAECLPLSVLTKRALDIWKAVKEDEFLFYFQNTEEMKQFHQFKEEYHEICANFTADMGKWKVNYLRKVKPMHESSAITKEYKKNLLEELNCRAEEVSHKVHSLLGQKKYWLIKNRAQYFKEDFLDRVKCIDESIMCSLERSAEMLTSESWMEITAQIRQASQTLAERNRHTEKDNVNSLERDFCILWERELYKAKLKLLGKMRDESVQEEIFIAVTNSLRDLYHDSLLGKDIKKHMTRILNIQALKHIIEGNRFLWCVANDMEIFSKYVQCLKHLVNITKSPTSVKSVEQYVQTFEGFIIGKTNIDCSSLSSLFVVTKQFQGKISSEILATLILKLSLWMTPLILRTTVLKDWELIQHNLENLRGNFYDEYICACMVVTKKEFQTYQRFYSFIQCELANSIQEELCTTLLTKFRSSIFTSKENLLNNILLELCEKKSFSDYIMYLKNTKGFIEQWTLNFISTSCVGSSDHSGYVSIETIAQGLVDAKIQVIIDILHKRLQNPVVGYHELFRGLFRDIGRLADVWYDQSYIEKFKIAFNYLSVKEFADEFFKIIKDLKGTLMHVLKVPVDGSDFDSVKHWFSNVAKTHKELISNLRLCFAVCPFCPTTCDETDLHKVHRSFRHLPRGLGGTWFQQKSPHLVTDDCTALVASESTYVSRRSHPSQWNQPPSYYRDYQKDYPDWYIHPLGMSEDNPADYWKWVLKEFNCDFARYYQVNEAQIPSVWNAITKEDVVSSLGCSPDHKIKWRAPVYI